MHRLDDLFMYYHINIAYWQSHSEFYQCNTQPMKNNRSASVHVVEIDTGDKDINMGNISKARQTKKQMTCWKLTLRGSSSASANSSLEDSVYYSLSCSRPPQLSQIRLS